MIDKFAWNRLASFGRSPQILGLSCVLFILTLLLCSQEQDANIQCALRRLQIISFRVQFILNLCLSIMLLLITIIRLCFSLNPLKSKHIHSAAKLTIELKAIQKPFSYLFLNTVSLHSITHLPNTVQFLYHCFRNLHCRLPLPTPHILFRLKSLSFHN